MIRGRHLGPRRGLPATGCRLEFPLCGIFTFDDEDRRREPDSAMGRITTVASAPPHDGANRRSEDLGAVLKAWQEDS
jgi:hypothetical protein